MEILAIQKFGRYIARAILFCRKTFLFPGLECSHGKFWVSITDRDPGCINSELGSLAGLGSHSNLKSSIVFNWKRVWLPDVGIYRPNPISKSVERWLCYPGYQWLFSHAVDGITLLTNHFGHAPAAPTPETSVEVLPDRKWGRSKLPRLRVVAFCSQLEWKARKVSQKRSWPHAGGESFWKSEDVWLEFCAVIAIKTDSYCFTCSQCFTRVDTRWFFSWRVRRTARTIS